MRIIGRNEDLIDSQPKDEVDFRNISRKTLVSYMQNIASRVEKTVGKSIPSVFPSYMTGGLEEEHIMYVFTQHFRAQLSGAYNQLQLGCSPMEHEDSTDAK